MMSSYNYNVPFTTNTAIPAMINEINSGNNSDSFETDIVMPSNQEPTGLQMGFSYTSVYFRPTGPQAGPSHVTPSMFMGPQAGPSFLPPSMFFGTQARVMQMPFSMNMQAGPLQINPSMFMGPQAGTSQVNPSMFMGLQAGPSQVNPSMFMGPQAGPSQVNPSMFMGPQAGPSQVNPSMFMGPQEEPPHVTPSMFMEPQTEPMPSIYMQPPEMQAGPSHLYHQQAYTNMPQTSTDYAIDTNTQPDIMSQSDIDEVSESEVVVTSHTKPPQDRMPDIIDLAGSDSNPTPFFGVSDVPAVKHHQPCPHSTSDSDSVYERCRRKRRHQHESDDSTTSATSRSTPERRSEQCVAPVCLHTTPASESSSDDHPCVREKSRRRLIRFAPQTARRTDRRTHRRDTRDTHRHVTSSTHHHNSDKRNTHKSQSSRSYNNNEERGSVLATATTSRSAIVSAPSAHNSSSERRRRHRDSHEMSQRNTEESNSNNQLEQTPQLANCKMISNAGTVQTTDLRLSRLPPKRATESPSSSDCIPINLIIHNRYLQKAPLNLTLQKQNPTSM